MHPPSWVCEQLYRIHPQLRLAWMGRPPIREGELDPGQFVVVQLYHISDCGSLDDPQCFEEFWTVDTVLDELGAPHNVRVERGPIFNRHGGTTFDWDPLFRKPVLKWGVNRHFDLCTRDVYSGRILDVIKANLLPVIKRKEKRRKQLRAAGRQLENRVNDTCTEMGNYLWHEASKTGETGVTMARKHIREEPVDNYTKAYREGKLGFEDFYERNAPV